MGAWGTGHFDNDDAGDWIWELEDSKSLGPVETAISAVNSSEYVEAPDACIALAAAETIAAATGKPAPNLPDAVTSVLSSLGTSIPADLLAQARTAIERVLADSELRELWEDTDDFAEWQASVRDLLKRLV